MTAFNCLTFALNAWHADGGYLVARRSAHWGVPHLIVVTPEGLQHYAPGAWLFALGATLWACSRLVRNMWRAMK
ncbi:hypothetical protein [Pseudothauera rhizosphaerae]|uniref:Uncharacterized protein n=1 Tax=Pseudothauera rhizosphaerae TaxID=2565932 RepID=A0A4V3W9N6_9RHOO|nr:hypothetical protein [Pseudothauera rhizosphaerae]THF55911.1 hypothetical protein E6O51_20205 [Pseudothauera rhizosphaerae]